MTTGLYILIALQLIALIVAIKLGVEILTENL